MQRKTRKRFEGTCESRFLTFSCYDRQNLLGHSEIRDAFVERLRYVHGQVEIDLYSWVVMPNHVHLIVRPLSEDVTVSAYLHLLKRTFAYRQLKTLRDQGNDLAQFWQAGGGYERNLWSQEEFEEKRDYIHENPVRMGLVTSAEDWRWSSMGWPEMFWDEC